MQHTLRVFASIVFAAWSVTARLSFYVMFAALVALALRFVDAHVLTEFLEGNL
jgi:hypothetical protein